MTDLPSTDLLLGFPPFGVPTAEVFRRMARRLTLQPNAVSLPVHFSHKWPEENDFSFVSNDLEAVVFEGWPELERFRDALLGQGARRALLSGSGSTVYGIMPERGEQHERDRSMNALRGRFPGWQLVATRSVQHAVRLEPTG